MKKIPIADLVGIRAGLLQTDLENLGNPEEDPVAFIAINNSRAVTRNILDSLRNILDSLIGEAFGTVKYQNCLWVAPSWAAKQQ